MIIRTKLLNSAKSESITAYIITTNLLLSPNYNFLLHTVYRNSVTINRFNTSSKPLQPSQTDSLFTLILVYKGVNFEQNSCEKNDCPTWLTSCWKAGWWGCSRSAWRAKSDRAFHGGWYAWTSKGRTPMGESCRTGDDATMGIPCIAP